MLFVYNMLLTGFDYEREKAVWSRVIKAHNLLSFDMGESTLQFEYGYVIDFVTSKKSSKKPAKTMKELEVNSVTRRIVIATYSGRRNPGRN